MYRTGGVPWLLPIFRLECTSKQVYIYIYTFNTLNLAGHFYIVVDTTTWGVKCIEPYLG